MRRLRVPAPRPGPLGRALLLPTWVVLGLALLLYVVGVMVFSFLAVLVATVRLLLAAPGALLGRLLPRSVRRPWCPARLPSTSSRVASGA